MGNIITNSSYALARNHSIRYKEMVGASITNNRLNYMRELAVFLYSRHGITDFWVPRINWNIGTGARVLSWLGNKGDIINGATWSEEGLVIDKTGSPRGLRIPNPRLTNPQNFVTGVAIFKGDVREDNSVQPDYILGNSLISPRDYIMAAHGDPAGGPSWNSLKSTTWRAPNPTDAALYINAPGCWRNNVITGGAQIGMCGGGGDGTIEKARAWCDGSTGYTEWDGVGASSQLNISNIPQYWYVGFRAPNANASHNLNGYVSFACAFNKLLTLEEMTELDAALRATVMDGLTIV